MVVVTGTLYCSDGTTIPILNASMSNGTSAEVLTNTAYSVVASSVGTYAAGKTVIASSPIVGTNTVSWAYLLRRGQIIQTYPVGSAGMTNMAYYPLCNSVTLMAGDQLICMPNSASDREAALVCYTSAGNNHIFSVTPSGAATNALTSIITGQSIGDTFQGQTIVKAFLTSVDGIKITSGGGVYVVNDKGVPVGGISATNQQSTPVNYSMCSIPVNLNFSAQLITAS